MSHLEHQHAAAALVARVAVLTLSDTRTPDTDTSGTTIERLLKAAGNDVVDRRLIRDEPARLRGTLDEWLASPAIDCVITTGGTGLSPRDQTVATIRPLLDREIDGFGELFRTLSFREIGSAAMLSLATAGVARGKLVFALPGSTAAVTLAMEQLILPQLRHLIREIRKT